MRFWLLKYGYPIILTAALLEGCYRDKSFTPCKAKNDKPIFFPFFLWQKTMIVNQEQNNELEGHYLKITGVINDSTFKINLPDSFYLNPQNITSWMVGWPTGKPYYDAGNENLAEIAALQPDEKIVVLGKLLRGSGKPQLNQRVVFWNRNPSGFKNLDESALVNPAGWKKFAGRSIEFGAIIFDTIRQQWIMYLQEVDTTHVNIYAAVSADFKTWLPANNGEPVLKPEDFKEANWAGLAEDGITEQTARLYSCIKYKESWYMFLSGYGKDGKRDIGIIKTQNPVSGPFEVIPTAVLNPGNDGPDMNGCFYPKVCAAGNKFLMYYDGVSGVGVETVCLAESEDLLHWKKFEGNPVIDNHYGWRSGSFTSEPNYIVCSHDTVWLMAGGYKKYNTEFTRQDSLEHRLPLDTSVFNNSENEKGKHISGNVMDAQLGVFISTDGGHHFRPHINNPVWLCDYADTLQNDHSGGDFFYNGKDAIIYQAKSENLRSYNILMRKK